MADELRVHARLSDAAGDQLRVLAAEIDDEHGPFPRCFLGRPERQNLSGQFGDSGHVQAAKTELGKEAGSGNSRRLLPRLRTQPGDAFAAAWARPVAPKGPHLTPIVGRLLRDRHVVRVALLEACAVIRTNRVLNFISSMVAGAAVAHRLPQPADELVDHRLHGPL